MERAAANVQIRVRSTENEEQDAGVEEARKAFDSSHRDGDDEGTGFGRGFPAVRLDELSGVVRDDHAEKEDGQDVEDENAVKGKADGARHSFPRVLRFSNSDTNEFGAEISEDGCHHTRPEAQELTRPTCHDVGLESTRILPVSSPRVSI